MSSEDVWSGPVLESYGEIDADDSGSPPPRARSWLGLDLGWAYGVLLPGLGRRTACPQRAEDVLHDAFVRYAVRARNVDQPNAYLHRIAQHVLVDHVRDASHYVAMAELPEAPASTAMDTPSPEQSADLQERLQALQQVMDALPPRAREVFWLFRIEGFRQAEIAQRLGISVNMVERHVMRALVDLRAARQRLDADA